MFSLLKPLLFTQNIFSISDWPLVSFTAAQALRDSCPSSCESVWLRVWCGNTDQNNSESLQYHRLIMEKYSVYVID